jgi:hypothetical protein
MPGAEETMMSSSQATPEISKAPVAEPAERNGGEAEGGDSTSVPTNGVAMPPPPPASENAQPAGVAAAEMTR